MIHQQARQSLEKTREAMGRSYNWKAKQQADFKIGDMVMLNAKNIRTKRPSKKVSPSAIRTFQKPGTRSRACVQTQIIGTLENLPGISCIATRALSNIYLTSPRTTTYGTRRDRW